MDAQPKLAPCDAEDLDKLLHAQAAVKRKLLIYAAGFGMTVYLWLSYPVLLLRLILGLLWLFQAFGLMFLFSRYRAFSRDLSEGQKLLEPGLVENLEDFDREGVKLDPARPVFFLRVNGREVGVSENVYRQCQKGDAVEVMLAPHSSYVLGATRPAIPE
jgi:hypothetical protein